LDEPQDIGAAGVDNRPYVFARDARDEVVESVAIKIDDMDAATQHVVAFDCARDLAFLAE